MYPILTPDDIMEAQALQCEGECGDVTEHRLVVKSKSRKDWAFREATSAQCKTCLNIRYIAPTHS